MIIRILELQKRATFVLYVWNYNLLHKHINGSVLDPPILIYMLWSAAANVASWQSVRALRNWSRCLTLLAPSWTGGWDKWTLSTWTCHRKLFSAATTRHGFAGTLLACFHTYLYNRFQRVPDFDEFKEKIRMPTFKKEDSKSRWTVFKVYKRTLSKQALNHWPFGWCFSNCKTTTGIMSNRPKLSENYISEFIKLWNFPIRLWRTGHSLVMCFKLPWASFL